MGLGIGQAVSARGLMPSRDATFVQEHMKNNEETQQCADP